METRNHLTPATLGVKTCLPIRVLVEGIEPSTHRLKAARLSGRLHQHKGSMLS